MAEETKVKYKVMGGRHYVNEDGKFVCYPKGAFIDMEPSKAGKYKNKFQRVTPDEKAAAKKKVLSSAKSGK